MGALIGYARVSSQDQNFDVQIAALTAAGCNPIRQEKKSGTTTEGRTELASVLDFLRSGDTLVVTRIDRLARSIADLADIVRQLEKKGVALKATEQPIDTSTPAGRAFLQMLGVFAEFETAIRRERQMEGIAKTKEADKSKPKADRKYKGRPANQNRNAEIANMIRAKVPWSKIMDETCCSRGTVAKVAAMVKAEASAA